GRGRGVQLFAKGTGLSAGIVAGVVQSAGGGRDPAPQDEGPKLVPGPDAVGEILGRGTRLPPHGADFDDIRAARGPAVGPGGRAASALGPAPAQPQGAQGG